MNTSSSKSLPPNHWIANGIELIGINTHSITWPQSFFEWDHPNCGEINGLNGITRPGNDCYSCELDNGPVEIVDFPINILQWLMVSSCKDLIGTLWGLPKPHGNPTQTLCFSLSLPRACVGLWWELLLAGHSLCGSRPSIGLVSVAIITSQKRNWCS